MRFHYEVWRSDHPQVGADTTHHFQIGRLHINVSFSRGVYGHRHTPSVGVRAWFA